jgi:drug/metabolite transporter (DMT)-like permease
MTPSILGILAAFGALAGWSFGDYFIQRSTRDVGDWKSLFYNGLFGLIILTPFVYKELPGLFSLERVSLLLLVLAAVTFIAAILEFEALREGKLSIIEPVLGTELLFTVALSVLFLKEHLSLVQIILILMAFLGIVLAVTKRLEHLKIHQRIFERGVLVALIGAAVMGSVNFLTGISAREASPLLALWAVEALLLFVCTLYLALKRQLPNIPKDLRQFPGAILGQGVLDNLAWVSFAYSMTLIPISVATTISESYIVFTAFLGIKLNGEKIRPHQKIGAILAIFGILALSLLEL